MISKLKDTLDTWMEKQHPGHALIVVWDPKTQYFAPVLDSQVLVDLRWDPQLDEELAEATNTRYDKAAAKMFFEALEHALVVALNNTE